MMNRVGHGREWSFEGTIPEFAGKTEVNHEN